MSDITNRSGNAPAAPTRSEVDTFLADLKTRTSTSTHGRLIFALDATASREATWDTACTLQAEMFQEAGRLGSLEMQLVFYRGLGECRASRWLSDSTHLAKTMSQIMCRAGQTQIEKILAHAAKETKLLKVSALVFVGDALEESPDIVLSTASTLGRLGVPVFMFQEGHDREVEQTFQDITRLTHGGLLSLQPRGRPSIGRTPTRRRGLCYRRIGCVS